MFGQMRFQGGDRRNWRFHYCGTCKTMGRQYGQPARMLLNHDAVFLAELLNFLAAGDPEQWSAAYASWNCLRLPSAAEIPPVLRYVSAVTILLAGYKAADHAADSRKRIWLLAQRVFSSKWRKARRELRALGFPVEACDAMVGRQQSLEVPGAALGVVAGPTAEATALVFRHGARIASLAGREDELALIGYRFGALTYLIDAWDDYEADRKSGAFNPLGDRAAGAQQVRADTLTLAALLPEPFAHRLNMNIASTLGLRIVHTCQQSRVGLRERFRQAMARTRALGASPLAFAAVLLMAFLFPAQARTAKSPHECLSFAMNLMALGSLIAMAAGGDPPAVKGAGKQNVLKSVSNCCCPGCDCGECCCEGCTDCSCDCCCESCCSSCDCG